ERTRPHLSINSDDDSPSPPKQLIRPDFNIFQYSFEKPERPARLRRRHTINICEIHSERKVHS
ncbi:unnamed protein product, partial [Candidula unifasciata]